MAFKKSEYESESFFILIVLFFASCGSLPKSIEIINPTSFDRKNEIVEIKNQEILKHFDHSASYTLKNKQNEEVPYQIIVDDNKTDFPFQIL